jgi:hypothetical protein
MSRRTIISLCSCVDKSSYTSTKREIPKCQPTTTHVSPVIIDSSLSSHSVTSRSPSVPYVKTRRSRRSSGFRRSRSKAAVFTRPTAALHPRRATRQVRRTPARRPPPRVIPQVPQVPQVPRVLQIPRVPRAATRRRPPHQTDHVSLMFPGSA